VDDGKIAMVRANIQVQGENEWLLAEWAHTAEFRREDPHRYPNVEVIGLIFMSATRPAREL
jgi:hypothetical protein